MLMRPQMVWRMSRVSTRMFSSATRDAKWERRDRTHNMSAGPSTISNNVLERAQAEMLDYNETGMNILEMSHRDTNGPVQQMITTLQSNLRTLLKVPDNYHILLNHGGANAQFSAVPLNLLNGKSNMQHVNTGFWATRAMNEAKKYGDVTLAWDAQSTDFKTLSPVSEWNIDPDAAFIHMCANETMHGLEYFEDPVLPANSPPLVSDFTSTILSRPIDVKQYGVIYAAGGKNLGPSGICLLIVREDLLTDRTAHELTPAILDWRNNAMNKADPIQNIYNTPSLFQMYMMKLITDDMLALHGPEAVESMREKAVKNAALFYDMIDNSNGFYYNGVDSSCRSRMNIPFKIHGPKGNKELEARFVQEADHAGILQTFAHPFFGGMRITNYNQTPQATVDAMASFMEGFAKRN